jgi:hypothetical protein
VRIPSQQEEKSISAANGKASVKDDFHIITIKITWMQIFLFPFFSSANGSTNQFIRISSTHLQIKKQQRLS